jgi:hypothetical protein
MPPPSPFLQDSRDPISGQPGADEGNQAPPSPDRPWYATGVLLDAEDFQAEQLYHRARLAEAVRGLGGCGTLAGLKVEWRDARAAQGDSPAREEEILVQPGLAVDRFGRLIAVSQPTCLRLNPWLARLKNTETLLRDLSVDGGTIQEIVADVFLRFLALPRGYTPAQAAGPFDATDAVQPSRVRDSHLLLLQPRPNSMPLLGWLPEDPWAEVRTPPSPANRWAELQRLILEGGPSGAERWSGGTAPPRSEHEGGVDPRMVFLARLRIPVSPAGAPPLRRLAGQAVTVRNDLREFVLSIPALAAWAGMPVRSTP